MDLQRSSKKTAPEGAVKDLFCWFRRALERPAEVTHGGGFSVSFWFLKEGGILPRPEDQVANCDLVPARVHKSPDLGFLVRLKTAGDKGLLGHSRAEREIGGLPGRREPGPGFIVPVV